MSSTSSVKTVKLNQQHATAVNDTSAQLEPIHEHKQVLCSVTTLWNTSMDKQLILQHILNQYIIVSVLYQQYPQNKDSIFLSAVYFGLSHHSLILIYYDSQIEPVAISLTEVLTHQVTHQVRPHLFRRILRNM